MFGWFKKPVPNADLQMKSGQVAFLKPTANLYVGDLLIDGRRIRAINKYTVLGYDRVYFLDEYAGEEFYYKTKVWIVAEKGLYGDEFVDGLAIKYKEEASRP